MCTVVLSPLKLQSKKRAFEEQVFLKKNNRNLPGNSSDLQKVYKE